METFLRFEQLIMFAYNEALDAYQLIEDDGRGFPYEFYDEITLAGNAYYDLYLETKDSYPSVSSDIWIYYTSAPHHIRSLQSKTAQGKAMNETLASLMEQYVELHKEK